MQHWYVYHSGKNTGYGYASLGKSAVYSRKPQNKLCFNDVIWVIESTDEEEPRFYLADCFHYTSTEYAHFPRGYEDFEQGVVGDKSLIDHAEPLQLDAGRGWFKKLYTKYIAKHKVFQMLDHDAEIVQGLEQATGLSF